MEINLKQLSTQATEATTGVKKMRLSENATSMVFQMFTKNIYSNPIGTVVREITSNCFDSHIEAGINKPVIIKKSFDKEANTIYISFIDFGVGMSPDRIENIYGTYFESTKRGDNSQIGGFGIGGKTPLAYKRSTGHGEGEYDNSYYVITIFDKVKYYYMIYEGAEAPEWSLLHQEETKEHNGTEVRIPVLERDVETFKKEMVRQLYYFENIIFEGFEVDENSYSSRYDDTLTNKYSIVRGKSFLFRGTEYSDNMHVCLGRVAYPIDYNVLGLSSSDYRLPVAVRLEVGDINVTASRETLDYNEHTIKILKKKLVDAKAEITALLAKQYSNIVTLEDYFMVKNSFGTLKFSNGVEINVGRLIEQKDVDFSNFRYSFMKMPNDRQLFKFFFEVKSYGKKPSRSRYSSKYEFEGGYEELGRNSNLLYIEGEFNRKIVKQAYLKSVHDLYHIINCRDITQGFVRAEIAEIFNVHLDKSVDENGKPVDYVKSLIDMQEEYFAIVQKYAKDYDQIEVPEDFVANRKKKNGLSEDIKNSTIPVRFVGHYGKERVKVSTLLEYQCPIFYATQEQEHQIRRIYDLYCALFDSNSVVTGYSSGYGSNPSTFTTGYNSYYNRNSNQKDKKNSIMFIIVAQGNVKYMEFCKKAYKVEDFFSKILYRKEDKVMTYFQTYDLKNRWANVSELYHSANFIKVNEKWGKKINEIKDFVGKLPKVSNNESLGHLKDSLSKYFDLSNIKMTAEQKKIDKLIGEVKGLERNNEKALSYIYFRNDGELKDETLINILKVVMTF
jgi:hypothetical protein